MLNPVPVQLRKKADRQGEQEDVRVPSEGLCGQGAGFKESRRDGSNPPFGDVKTAGSPVHKLHYRADSGVLRPYRQTAD